MSDTSLEELDRIARAARDAFAVTSAADVGTRSTWLRAIADRLDEHRNELVALAVAETALAPARLEGEVARTTGQLRMFADVIEEGSYLEAIIDHAAVDATPPRPDLRRILVATGPVAVFAASNFPFAFSVAGGDTASALAVGCPVVVKAHPGHPRVSRRTAALVADALADNGAPAGAFAVVEGHEAGIALVEHPAITAVGFTGSTAGGRALFDRASARPDPIPFYGELGSINPVVVTRGADAARGAALAEGLAASFQLGAGQFCTKPGVVFVPTESTLESSLATHVGREGAQLLTRSIRSGFGAGVDALLDVPGVEVVAGAPTGDRPDEAAAPIVVAVDLATAREHPEQLFAEVFGPATVLVRYDDAAELRGALSELEGTLTATLHAEADEAVDDVVSVLSRKAGRVLFAGWPTGVAVTWSQHHGGPWPATTSSFTSVGATAVRRFQRPLVFQDAPASLLPPALQDANPLGIPRRVDGRLALA